MPFFFFSYIDLDFLIPEVIPQIFNPTAELAMPIGMTINEVKAEIETQLLIAEINISKCSM